MDACTECSASRAPRSVALASPRVVEEEAGLGCLRRIATAADERGEDVREALDIGQALALARLHGTDRSVARLGGGSVVASRHCNENGKSFPAPTGQTLKTGRCFRVAAQREDPSGFEPQRLLIAAQNELEDRPGRGKEVELPGHEHVPEIRLPHPSLEQPDPLYLRIDTERVHDGLRDLLRLSPAQVVEHRIGPTRVVRDRRELQLEAVIHETIKPRPRSTGRHGEQVVETVLGVQPPKHRQGGLGGNAVVRSMPRDVDRVDQRQPDEPLCVTLEVLPRQRVGPRATHASLLARRHPPRPRHTVGLGGQNGRDRQRPVVEPRDRRIDLATRELQVFRVAVHGVACEPIKVAQPGRVKTTACNPPDGLEGGARRGQSCGQTWESKPAPRTPNFHGGAAAV